MKLSAKLVCIILIMMQTRAVFAQSQGPAGVCSSTELVFVVDDTYSLGGAIWDMKQEIHEIISLVAHVSDGHYRAGLVTFKDDITVRMDLAEWSGDNQSMMENRLEELVWSLSARGGNSGPEASDEAMNTIIHSLPAGQRRQDRDFKGQWQAKTRIAILITDNLPGGFSDAYNFRINDPFAEKIAREASEKSIRISAIYVPTVANRNGVNPEVEKIMRRYAMISGGLYTLTDRSGQGTARAIADIIRSCGEIQLW